MKQTIAKMIVSLALVSSVFSLNQVYAFNLVSEQVPQTDKFPTQPDPVLTPGKLCNHPTEYRYPANIAYCERNVTQQVKKKIFEAYDKRLGFRTRTMERNDFKIDHFIPLSIGGGNDFENLWPQHKSVYEYTDRVESHVANLIAQDKITQSEAVRVVKECKLNIPRCADLEDYLKSLY
ncbi:MAG: hypothetical protein ACK41T_11800 [Pseudobdellovibrio sp.]